MACSDREKRFAAFVSVGEDFLAKAATMAQARAYYWPYFVEVSVLLQLGLEPPVMPFEGWRPISTWEVLLQTPYLLAAVLVEGYCQMRMHLPMILTPRPILSFSDSHCCPTT